MMELYISENTKHRRKDDIEQALSQFHMKVSSNRRDASYDFCYGYFQAQRHHLAENMELSCLHLWAYLASWGMLRGSSLLLKECSMKVLSGVVEYLDSLHEEMWHLDVQDYKSARVKHKISEIFIKLQERIKDIELDNSKKHVSATTTLITKIMLGTLGCIPAFDQNFVVAFKKEFEKTNNFRKVDKNTLKCIYEFYQSNHDLFHPAFYPVIGFNGKPIMNLHYTYAKLIDMYGFNKGSQILKEKSNNSKKQKSL